MTRFHGKDARVFLGGREASSDLVAVDLKPGVDTHDVTTFGAEWKNYQIGLAGWEGLLSGFYDPASGGFGRQLEAVGDGTAGLGVISVWENDGSTLGDLGVLGSEAVLTTRTQSINVADMTKLSGELKGVGRLGLAGRLLHVLAARTTSADGSSVDNGASSASGGRGNLHVTAITGAATVKIQHSTDNSSWTDLITFSPSTSGGSTSEVSGTVNRYLRASWTPGTTITFTLGFARY